MLASTGLMPPTWASSGVPSCPRMPMSMLRAERTGPIERGVLALEDGGEAGDAALDGLLEHDVGLVDAGLGPAGRVVVDLDRHGRALRDGPARGGHTGEGAGGRRGAVRGRLVGLACWPPRGAGEEEQALRRRPARPVVTSTPQASGCRTVERLVSDLGIAGRRSYGGGARKWWHTRVGAGRRGRRPGGYGSGGRGAGGRAGCGRGAGVDGGPIAARGAVGAGGAEAEAAVDVLHGPADDLGRPREWRGR